MIKKENNKPLDSLNKKSVNSIDMTKLKKSESQTDEVNLKAQKDGSVNDKKVEVKRDNFSELKAFGAEFVLEDWIYMVEKQPLFIKYLEENNIPAARELAKKFYCKIK